MAEKSELDTLKEQIRKIEEEELKQNAAGIILQTLQAIHAESLKRMKQTGLTEQYQIYNTASRNNVFELFATYIINGVRLTTNDFQDLGYINKKTGEWDVKQQTILKALTEYMFKIETALTNQTGFELQRQDLPIMEIMGTAMNTFFDQDANKGHGKKVWDIISVPALVGDIPDAFRYKDNEDFDKPRREFQKLRTVEQQTRKSIDDIEALEKEEADLIAAQKADAAMAELLGEGGGAAEETPKQRKKRLKKERQKKEKAEEKEKRREEDMKIEAAKPKFFKNLETKAEKEQNISEGERQWKLFVEGKESVPKELKEEILQLEQEANKQAIEKTEGGVRNLFNMVEKRGDKIGKKFLAQNEEDEQRSIKAQEEFTNTQREAFFRMIEKRGDFGKRAMDRKRDIDAQKKSEREEEQKSFFSELSQNQQGAFVSATEQNVEDTASFQQQSQTVKDLLSLVESKGVNFTKQINALKKNGGNGGDDDDDDDDGGGGGGGGGGAAVGGGSTVGLLKELRSLVYGFEAPTKELKEVQDYSKEDIAGLSNISRQSLIQPKSTLKNVRFKNILRRLHRLTYNENKTAQQQAEETDLANVGLAVMSAYGVPDERAGGRLLNLVSNANRDTKAWEGMRVRIKEKARFRKDIRANDRTQGPYNLYPDTDIDPIVREEGEMPSTVEEQAQRIAIRSKYDLADYDKAAEEGKVLDPTQPSTEGQPDPKQFAAQQRSMREVARVQGFETYQDFEKSPKYRKLTRAAVGSTDFTKWRQIERMITEKKTTYMREWAADGTTLKTFALDIGEEAGVETTDEAIAYNLQAFGQDRPPAQVIALNGGGEEIGDFQEYRGTEGYEINQYGADPIPITQPIAPTTQPTARKYGADPIEYFKRVVIPRVLKIEGTTYFNTSNPKQRFNAFIEMVKLGDLDFKLGAIDYFSEELTKEQEEAFNDFLRGEGKFGEDKERFKAETEQRQAEEDQFTADIIQREKDQEAEAVRENARELFNATRDLYLMKTQISNMIEAKDTTIPNLIKYFSENDGSLLGRPYEPTDDQGNSLYTHAMYQANQAKQKTNNVYDINGVATTQIILFNDFKARYLEGDGTAADPQRWKVGKEPLIFIKNSATGYTTRIKCWELENNKIETIPLSDEWRLGGPANQKDSRNLPTGTPEPYNNQIGEIASIQMFYMGSHPALYAHTLPKFSVRKESGTSLGFFENNAKLLQKGFTQEEIDREKTRVIASNPAGSMKSKELRFLNPRGTRGRAALQPMENTDLLYATNLSNPLFAARPTNIQQLIQESLSERVLLKSGDVIHQLEGTGAAQKVDFGVVGAEVFATDPQDTTNKPVGGLFKDAYGSQIGSLGGFPSAVSTPAGKAEIRGFPLNRAKPTAYNNTRGGIVVAGNPPIKIKGRQGEKITKKKTKAEARASLRNTQRNALMGINNQLFTSTKIRK